MSEVTDTFFQRMAALSPEQRALLELQLRKKGIQVPNASGIPRSIPRRNPYPPEAPLSFAQQRLWFLDQFQPNSAFYNLAAAFQLDGQLNLPIMEQALNEMVRRHEIWRSTFPTRTGQAVQVIHPERPLSLSCIDLSPLPSPAQAQEVERLATLEARTPFNLAEGSLLRGTVLKLGETQHMMLFTMHHIISDGWSKGVLIREIAVLYEALIQGRPSPLPELPIQYADFAVWQRQWLQGAVLENQLAYWRQQLQDAPPLLALPTDRPRPPVQTFRGETQSIVLPASLTQALKTLSQQENVTLFMTLLAAFQTLLHRYTDRTDILVGSPVANRNRTELEGLIGFFVNTLVLRTDLSGNPCFRELLHRVREVTLTAYAHEDLPFEKLVDELQPERNLSYMPLFQVMFQLQNLPPATLELPNLTLTPLEIDKQTTQCDLSLDLVEVGDRLQVSIEYSTDLFDRQTIHRWLAHFQTLLIGIVAQPDRRLSELPLLTDAEQQQILVEWSGRSQQLTIEQAAETDTCIHVLFEAQADATPAAIAVTFAEQTLTYATLNQRANQLAHSLQRLGVMPDVRVGIALERSPDLLVAVLAVLKAGGAYVPLDPTYPPERLRFMLNDSQVAVLITQSHLIRTGAPLASLLNDVTPVICLDADGQAIAQQRTRGDQPAADQLAYVIYTSGSTGTAKGVMVGHCSLVNAYRAWEAAYKLRSPEVRCHLQMANFAFDVFTGDWVRALCSGGKLVLCPRDRLLAPDQLYALMQQEQVDCAEFVPAVLRHLIQYLEASGQRLDFMRLLICGSDSWYVEEYETFRQFCGAQTRLINSFGLTEATIDSSYFEQTRVSRQGEQLVPIGRPFANTALYILNAYLQPVPIGVPGELHIGGMGLARGYLNRPDLTAARFIPNPFGEDPIGDRLYKTGDLARWLADGNLEFLGRMDAQDKIRGHRVEVAEIEAALCQHSEVQEAVVLVQQDPSGEKRLVAYVVPQIREENKDSLPDAALEAAQVAYWQTIYDNEAFETVSDPTFNISGWDSSYTGLPLPAIEMQAWVNQTIARILALQPRRILEIGCGTGLLLFRLAPHCDEYWGTDFSSHALNYTRQVLQRSNPQQGSVKLLHQPADCVDDLKSASFNTVILNSVVQYFPSIHYLLRVLEQVMPCVQPGGSIFIGDVRNLCLLEAFHASVQLYQSSDNTSRSQFCDRVQKRLEQEQELAIDPAFFLALQHHFPQIDRVHIQPKRGQDWNELTKFRYDVTLYTNAATNSVSELIPVSWRDWQAEGWSLPKLCQCLEIQQPDWLAFTRVPNLRVLADVKTVDWLSTDAGLETGAGLKTVGDFRTTTGAVMGVDPEAIWNLSHTLPYDVDIHWASGRADGSYEVVFRRHSAQNEAQNRGRLDPIALPPENSPLRPWHTYANHPLQAQQIREWVPQLRAYLKQKLPDYMVPSVWMRLDALPLTANGKIDRRALPAPDATRRDLPDTLAAPGTAIEKTLTEIWTQVLGVEPIGIHDNFFELGGDSILSIQIIAKANQAGLKLTPKQIFEAQTIAELAAIADTIQSVQAEQAVIVGDVPLTPIQQWFFEQNLPDPHHYNQAVLLDVRQPLDPVLLDAAIRHLLLHHDGLRLRFERTFESTGAAGWQQTIMPPDRGETDTTALVIHVDLSALLDSAQAIALETKASELQASLNLATGSLLRVALFDLDRVDASVSDTSSSHKPLAPRQRLLIIVHHLAIDGVSWRILLDDLQTAYQQLYQGQSVQLPAKSTSLKQWAEQLHTYAQSAAIESEQSYWLTLVDQPATALPVDNASGQNTVDSTRRLSVCLSAAETQALLQEVPKAYNTQINDVLLASFAQAFAEWTGTSTLTIDLEGHGREDLFANLDLSRTIGWFTSLFPVQVNLNGKTDPENILIAVKEQLRRIPKRGIGYGLLRYLKRDRRSIQPSFTAPRSAISFNYFGQFDATFSQDSPFCLIPEASGLTCSPRGQRPYLLELNGFVHQGQLWMEWTYSDQVHHRQTIECWAESWLKALRSLIAHCQAVSVRRYTPSDFPLTHLDQLTLDRLFSAYPGLEDLYPLSPVQQGILFHTLYAPHSSVYFDQWSCTLHGNLSLDTFQQAWQQVVDHHPAMRTAFYWQNLDQPLQAVHQHAPLSWVQLDWRNLSPATQQTQIKDFLQHDRQQPFDLSHSPLMRLTLIHLAAETHQFVWSHHHLLMDGWSTPLVLKQVLSLYEAKQQRQMLQLPRSRPYRDYITWLHQQDLSHAEAVWQHLLQGFTQPIALPTTAQNSANQEHLEQNVQIPIAITTKLQTLVRQHQLTLNTLIQGMWALLLHHCSGKSDVVFGATVSGRLPDLTGSDTMIGMLINTLPVRTQVPLETSLLPWLNAIQMQQAEVRQYEYTPLVKIQKWSELPSDRHLFDSIVVFQNYPIDPDLCQGNNLRIDNVKAVTQNNYALTLRATPGETLFLQLIYDRSQFSTETINKLLNYLSISLGTIAESADISLGAIIDQFVKADRQQQQIQEDTFKTASRQKLAMLKHRRTAPRLNDHHA
jgi:amino acid adenylation domain-containing protein/non-ribosomal peptide synthase protein (TIGR01720 family)